MNNRLFCVLVAGFFICDSSAGLRAQSAPGQERPEAKDTLGLPRLEIPEITIVGKKAITLPFARKGEIYDVNVYEAPPPDSGLLGGRESAPLPRGTLSRYEEHQVPWRASLEGSFGSFSTGDLGVYLDYKSQQWGIYGNGIYRTTQGHTINASGSTSELDVRAHSLLATDNDVLKTLRVSGGIGLGHDAYGMFGLPDQSTRRTRNNVDFGAEIGSANQQGNIVDLSLDARVWNISDRQSGKDSDVSVVSPDLRGSFRTDVQDVQLGADVTYRGSSLNYPNASQSPSLLGIAAGARWTVSDQWSVRVGGIYHNGSGSDGMTTSLVAPTAILQWKASQDREWIFWFQPEIHLTTYDEHIRENPYLIREILLRPERRPIRLGTVLSFRTDRAAIQLRGSFTHSTNRDITLADSGRIRLEYADADQVAIEGLGSIDLPSGTKVTCTGAVQPGHEAGTSVQLPMIPIIQLKGRAEQALGIPAALWASGEYMSRRNVDRAGNKTLGDVFLLGCGISTGAVPRAVVSFQIRNLLNTGYELWSGYSAPGRQFTLEAKINLQ
jgi:hypothetical protein